MNPDLPATVPVQKISWHTCHMSTHLKHCEHQTTQETTQPFLEKLLRVLMLLPAFPT